MLIFKYLSFTCVTTFMANDLAIKTIQQIIKLLCGFISQLIDEKNNQELADMTIMALTNYVWKAHLP